MKSFAFCLSWLMALTSFGLNAAEGPDFAATFDVTSGYLLYGALFNDDPCLQYGATTGYSHGNWGRLGIGAWSNSDLTHARSTFRRAFNENDFYLDYSNAFALNDEFSLGMKLIHMWYWYPRSHSPSDQGCPAKRELYVICSLDNPYLTPYAMFTHEYRLTHGSYWETGLRRAFSPFENFTLTPFVSVNFLSEMYMTIFPTVDGRKSAGQGIGVIRPGLMAEYRLTKNLSLRARCDYVAVLNHDVRDAIDAQDYTTYKKDFFWGSLGLTLSF